MLFNSREVGFVYFAGVRFVGPVRMPRSLTTPCLKVPASFQAWTGSEAFQKLNVVIDGKKYEREAPTLRANLQAGVALLALGDYKAKLVQDKHRTACESSQAPEFLFPDNTTRKFTVVGWIE